MFDFSVGTASRPRPVPGTKHFRLARVSAAAAQQ